MGGQQQAIISIGMGKCDDRLIGLAHLVQRAAHILQSHLPAAGKARQVQRNNLDPVILGRGFQRCNHIAGAVFSSSAPSRTWPGEGRAVSRP